MSSFNLNQPLLGINQGPTQSKSLSQVLNALFWKESVVSGYYSCRKSGREKMRQGPDQHSKCRNKKLQRPGKQLQRLQAAQSSLWTLLCNTWVGREPFLGAGKDGAPCSVLDITCVSWSGRLLAWHWALSSAPRLRVIILIHMNCGTLACE